MHPFLVFPLLLLFRSEAPLRTHGFPFFPFFPLFSPFFPYNTNCGFAQKTIDIENIFLSFSPSLRFQFYLNCRKNIVYKRIVNVITEFFSIFMFVRLFHSIFVCLYDYLSASLCAPLLWAVVVPVYMA